MRYPVPAAVLSASLLSLLALAQDVTYSSQGQQIPGPQCAKATQWNSGRPTVCSPDASAAWLHDVEHWRAERHFMSSRHVSRTEIAGLQASR